MKLVKLSYKLILSKYKIQRNLVVKINKKRTKEYFENLNVATNSKRFWDKCKLNFSNVKF